LKLQSDNELVRVKRDVSAEYEIAAVSAKLDGKQAVLFEKVWWSKIRVLCIVIATLEGFTLLLEVCLINHMKHMSRRISILALLKLSIAYRSLHEPKAAGYLKKTHQEAYTTFTY
jgi:UbiD family decarboxylase